jgi:hypothetical protein
LYLLDHHNLHLIQTCFLQSFHCYQIHS